LICNMQAGWRCSFLQGSSSCVLAVKYISLDTRSDPMQSTLKARGSCCPPSESCTHGATCHVHGSTGRSALRKRCEGADSQVELMLQTFNYTAAARHGTHQESHQRLVKLNFRRLFSHKTRQKQNPDAHH
jgi:hypothetical protein